MAHVRQQIREAVASALVDNTDAEDNVFESRVYPMDEASLPGIIVYTLNEANENITISSPRRQQRELTVVVELYVKATADVDDNIDDITAQIEGTIYADEDLQALVKDIVLAETDISLLGSAEQKVAVAKLSYTASYHVREGDLETIIS